MRRSMMVGLCLACCTQPAWAEQAWWKFWASDPAVTDALVDQTTQGLFSNEQRRLLKNFLREQQVAGDDDRNTVKDKKHKDKKPKKLPPGLKKKLERGGELPPGWQKKMARGEVVDDRVWAQSKNLPPDVLRRLGHQPDGTEIRYADDQVYRVMRNTMEILDVLGVN